ncbi:MAG: phosphonate C-P lyase system protein PhnK, partial [Mesorhizobium sp.]
MTARPIRNPAPQPPLLDVSGLSKSYGTQVGCRDISFAIRPG